MTVGKPVALGIVGAEHEVAVVYLLVMLRAERQQVARSLSSAAREEPNVVEL